MFCSRPVYVSGYISGVLVVVQGRQDNRLDTFQCWRVVGVQNCLIMGVSNLYLSRKTDKVKAVNINCVLTISWRASFVRVEVIFVDLE